MRRKNSTGAEESSQEPRLRPPHPETNVLLLSIKRTEKETNISAFSSVGLVCVCQLCFGCSLSAPSFPVTVTLCAGEGRAVRSKSHSTNVVHPFVRSQKMCSEESLSM